LDPERIGPEHRCSATFVKSKMLFENGIYGRGHLAVYENINATLPKAMMFRDSASSWILPFSESVARRSPAVFLSCSLISLTSPGRMNAIETESS